MKIAQFDLLKRFESHFVNRYVLLQNESRIQFIRSFKKMFKT